MPEHKRRKKLKVPASRPFTRAPIKPMVRHQDKRRQEKHKKRMDDKSE